MAFDAKHKKAVASDAKLATTMAGSANFEDKDFYFIYCSSMSIFVIRIV